jgi:protease-4
MLEESKSAQAAEGKNWKLLETTLLAGVQEQRRARRWGIFFKSLTFVYLFGALALFSPLLNLQKAATRGENHTALIEVRGMIADREAASADNIVGSLREAFDDPKTKGVILHKDIKVYAVITDLGASGAYYIASAADEIYADKSSLVGSIGVTAATFGFVEVMNKLGVERRVYTSGEHKAFLDPFQPQKAEETQFWQSVLETTHRQFIDSVKQGRGERLKVEEHPELFSGLIWSGEQALALGLIDKLGNSSYVARDVIGAKDIVDFTVQDSPLDHFAKKLGASVAEQLAMWVGFQGPALR